SQVAAPHLGHRYGALTREVRCPQTVQRTSGALMRHSLGRRREKGHMPLFPRGGRLTRARRSATLQCTPSANRGRVTEAEHVAMPDLLAHVNARIHELVEDRLASGEDELWGFRCECGEPGCRESVQLSLHGYEELRAADAVLL